MKKKNIIIIVAGTALLAALIIGAVILYNHLSGRISTDNVIEYQPAQTDDSSSAELSEADGPEGDDAEEDYTAPDFSFVDYNGNSFSISELKGKPIVLNFWASWCPPCREEMPYFEEMYSIYKDDVEFLMVNLTDGTQETLKTAKAFYDEQGYTFPVYFDTSGEGAANYYIRYIPDTFFIDASGDLYSYSTGAITQDALEEGILSIIR